MARADQIAAFVGYLNRVADNAEGGIVQALHDGATEMVDLAQAACPDNDIDEHPGQLRESIHEIDGDDALMVRVVADAQDAKGDYYGAHVELGHIARDGGHVPAQPFFWPSWHLVKRGVKARIFDAAKAAIKGS